MIPANINVILHTTWHSSSFIWREILPLQPKAWGQSELLEWLMGGPRPPTGQVLCAFEDSVLLHSLILRDSLIRPEWAVCAVGWLQWGEGSEGRVLLSGLHSSAGDHIIPTMLQASFHLL